MDQQIILVETHYDSVLMKQLNINNEFVFSKRIDMNVNTSKNKII